MFNVIKMFITQIHCYIIKGNLVFMSENSDNISLDFQVIFLISWF